MKCLYKVIEDLKGIDFDGKHLDDSHIGYLFVKAVSEMNSKEGKYLSRYNPSDDSSDAKRVKTMKSLKRNFIRGLMAYFTHNDIEEVPEVSLEEIKSQPRVGIYHSIEEPLFDMICGRFAGGRETLDEFYAGIGSKIIAAEAEYTRMQRNKNADHVKEYNLLLKHIVG